MSKMLRYLLIAVGVLIVALIAIPFFLSPNQFRPTIEEKISAALGRQVKVGNMSLSLFSGALSADDLSIADDPAFSKTPFLTAKSLKVGVEMQPLILSRALHITGVTIEKPEVSLVKNADGQWNVSTLATSDAKSAPQPAGSSASAADISIAKLQLKDGRVTIGSTTSSKTHAYEDVQLEAFDVSATSSIPFSMTAKLPGGGGVKIDGKAGPIDSKDATLSPLDAKIAIQSMDLGGTGFVDASTGLAGSMDLNTTISSKGGAAHSQGDIKLNKLQVRKGGAPSGVPVDVNFDSDYDLRRSAGKLNEGTVKVGSALAHLAGTYDLKGESAVLNMKVNAENMPVQDLQAFLPALGVVLPKGSSLQQGTLNSNLNVEGPANKLVTTGTVGLYNAKLAGFDLGSKMAVLNTLTGNKAGSSDTSIQKLTSNVRVAPEGIRTDAMDLIIPALGEVTGGGTMSADNNLDFKMVAALTSSGGMGAVGGLLGGGGGKGTKLPFRIAGTASDPKFIPDVSGVAKGMAGSLAGGLLNGQKGKPGLANALGGLFGKKN